MLGEHLAHPPEQPAGGLHAGAGDDGDEDEELLLGELAALAGEVVELDVQQLGDEVVGGVLCPPGDVVGVGLAAEVAVLGDLQRLAGLVAQLADGGVAHRRLVGFGDAHEHADGLDRHLGAEVEHEVEPVVALERVEAGGAERPDLVLELLHPARGERPGDQGPVHRVLRRVLVDEDARRHDRVGLDHLEDVALGRAQPRGVLQRGLDVGETAEAPEVESLVAVERRLVPQALVGRVRVGVDLDVVGVVVQVVAHMVVLGAHAGASGDSGRW